MLHCRTHHVVTDLAQSEEGGVKTFAEVPVGHGCEDLGHGGVIERFNSNEVEMACEAVGNGVPSSSRRAHSTHQVLWRHVTSSP